MLAQPITSLTVTCHFWSGSPWIFHGSRDFCGSAFGRLVQEVFPPTHFFDEHNVYLADFIYYEICSISHPFAHVARHVRFQGRGCQQFPCHAAIVFFFLGTPRRDLHQDRHHLSAHMLTSVEHARPATYPSGIDGVWALRPISTLIPISPVLLLFGRDFPEFATLWRGSFLCVRPLLSDIDFDHLCAGALCLASCCRLA